MKKSFSTLASVEFQQRSKFVVHDFSHKVHRPQNPSIQLRDRCVLCVSSFQLREFRFNLLEIWQCACVIVALDILNHTVAIDDEHCAFRHATHP